MPYLAEMIFFSYRDLEMSPNKQALIILCACCLATCPGCTLTKSQKHSVFHYKDNMHQIELKGIFRAFTEVCHLCDKENQHFTTAYYSCLTVIEANIQKNNLAMQIAKTQVELMGAASSL